MKRITYLMAGLLVAAIATVGCGSDWDPGRVYMPDMAYSRAYESYAQLDSNKFTTNPDKVGGKKIYYNAMPPAGTIKRGELFPYIIAHDTVGYRISAKVENPIAGMTKAGLQEAGRLYNINCAICHDAKGTGQGPVAAKVPGVANLTGDVYKLMTDGTMFYSITYGKNNMGSYASQLDRKQRWEVIKYIRSLQGVDVTMTSDSNTATATTNDSTVKK
ncbi:MAG TPA: cytochrome c [Ferruginibacter sp.]|nr:cytochrome c [Ferruginibacter sp.]